eukprot:m.90490 g.90490  ORF g.90490 m.90490 type:complete len:629 (+) comp16461_c0_seq2:37-1923(+)
MTNKLVLPWFAVAGMLCGQVRTACGSSVVLASGHRVSTAPAEWEAGVVYFSYDYNDNIVAATNATTKFATDHKYTANTAPAYFGVSEYNGAVPLKTFWSAKLNDTLTTASPQGLAWAANPENGYAFQRIEGYCSMGSAPTPTGAGQTDTYVQMWSDDRNDSFIVAVGSVHEQQAKDAKYVKKWDECFYHMDAPPIPGATGKWTKWDDQPQEGIPWPKSKDILGWEYLSGANPGYGGGDHIARSADTWYPSWGADGNLYSPWTDGSVHDDITGATVGSGSGGKTGNGYNSTTGQAIIVGDDPFNLTITNVKTFTSSTYPYQGRYPCGSLYYKKQWWYGTYYLDNPNATVGPNYVGPNPDPNCGNWCIQGPVVDFRRSVDNGASWVEDRVNASSASDNLFAETAQSNAKVKFGAPHWVDFGQELEHSPDGKAYLVGHGASRPEAIQAWMLGDEVYMARVEPTADAIADKAQWEFYAGGTGADAKWAKGDVSAAAPLVTWNNHTGVVTMTYFSVLKKYIMCISTASFYPYMTKQFDTYFLESDAITGPWAYVNYNSEFGPEAYFVHHPSKFLASTINATSSTYDAFLMYSANFAFHSGSMPPNSGYHMNLQQARFPLSSAFTKRLLAESTA